jgi:hypothetical protein
MKHPRAAHAARWHAGGAESTHSNGRPAEEIQPRAHGKLLASHSAKAFTAKFLREIRHLSRDNRAAMCLSLVESVVPYTGLSGDFDPGRSLSIWQNISRIGAFYMKKLVVIGVSVASLALLGGIGSAVQTQYGWAPLAANKSDRVTVYRDHQASSEVLQRESFIALQSINDVATSPQRFQAGWIPGATDMFRNAHAEVRPSATRSRPHKATRSIANRPTPLKVAIDQR